VNYPDGLTSRDWRHILGDIEGDEQTQCPNCGAWVADFDGWGVLAHGECGYCSHPSSTGGVCDICGIEDAE
jgi:primosomal protein N'